MENGVILNNMVRYGFNDLYLEVVDAPSVEKALQDIYNMTEEDIVNSKFEVANKILQLALINSGIKNKSDIEKSKDEKSMGTSEKYQIWMGIVIILLFGVSIMLLIYNPIPDGNNDLLVVLATWLGKDVTTIVSYYHGSSYSSFIKTKSMLRNEHEFNQTYKPPHERVQERPYYAKGS